MNDMKDNTLASDSSQAAIRQTCRSMVEQLQKYVEEIFPWDLVDELEANPDLLLLDVRCPGEFEIASISDSINVPRGVLEWKAESEDELKDKSAALVVYCKTGGRSALAAQTLQELGYTNVKSLAGGFEAWSGKS